MKNLENYGVQELNAVEMKETDGGFILALIAVVVSAAIIAAPIIAWSDDNPDNDHFNGMP